jgi:hypothetical protein
VTPGPYERLAAELSTNRPLTARLLLAHPADGVCPGCTVAGSQFVTTAPCSIRKLALLATEMRGPVR